MITQVDVLGLTATALVLIGYALNSQQRLRKAAIAWILGDIVWIIYDCMIMNIPHIVLSACIILLNMRAIKRLTKQRVRRSQY